MLGKDKEKTKRRGEDDSQKHETGQKKDNRGERGIRTKSKRLCLKGENGGGECMKLNG